MPAKRSPSFPIILFDGVCNFCNGSVNWIIRRDKRDRFRFAALQSDVGARLQAEHHLDPDALDTLVLIEDGRAHTKSAAALRIMRRLGGVYGTLSVLVIVPRPIRDLFYDLLARNRYRWFGRRDECMVPSGKILAKFLADDVPSES